MYIGNSEKLITDAAKEYCDRSAGEAFLKTMRNCDKNKIIDYFYDKEISKTAQEVYEQSIQIALNLQRLGIQKNDVIILYSANNEWSSVLTMGGVLAGAQMNFFDVHFHGNDVDHVFGVLQPAMIVYEEKYKSEIKESLKRQPLNTLKHIISIDGSDKIKIREKLLSMPNQMSSEDYDNFKSAAIENPQLEVCCLLLSGGTTGLPKVVQLTHAQVLYGIIRMWQLDDNSAIMSFAPLRWMTQVLLIFQSLIMCVKRVSCNGSKSDNGILTGSYGKDVLHTCGITNAIGAPSFYYDIFLELPENDTESLSCFKCLMIGGEAPFDILKQLAKKHCPNIKYFLGYGMTEMCGAIAYDEVINGGQILPGFQVLILDEQLQPVGPNVNGQIALKTPYPFLGYKGIDVSEDFILDGFFINGDYGFMDDKSNLHALCRYKYIVKAEKVMLIPGKVEFPILELPEVQATCMVGYRKSSQDQHEVGALFVVFKSNIKINENEMRLKIHQKLKTCLTVEEYSVLQDIHFISSAPQTTCGKTHREALKELAIKLSNA